MKIGENGVNPDHPEYTGAQNHDNRRYQTPPQASAGGDGAVHEGADGVGEAHNAHSLHARGGNRRVVGKDVQEGLGAEPEAHAQNGGNQEGVAKADVVAFVHPIRLARTPVLPHEGGAGGVEGGHHVINHVVHVHRRGISRNHHGIEGVDANLNEEVGNGKHRVLNAGGNAQPQNPSDLLPVQTQSAHFQAAAAAQPCHVTQHQNCRYVLGNHTGQCHALRCHAADNDEEQIQKNIQNSGNGQIQQRPPGVAGGTEHRVAEVENAQSGHTQGVDSEIEHRSGQQVFLGFQQLQQGRSQQQAQSGDEQSHQGA